MLIPKTSIVWINEEPNVVLVQQTADDDFLNESPGIPLNGKPGCSLLLTNNLCIEIAKPITQVQTEIDAGWLNVDENATNIILTFKDGTSLRSGWLDFWANLPHPDAANITLGMPIMPVTLRLRSAK